jgi:hypothetical protein
VGGLAGGRQGRLAGALAGAAIAHDDHGNRTGGNNGTGRDNGGGSHGGGETTGRKVLHGAFTGGFIGGLVGGSRRAALAGTAVGATVCAGRHAQGPGGQAVRSGGNALSAMGERIGQQSLGEHQNVGGAAQETKARVSLAWHQGCEGFSTGANNLATKIRGNNKSNYE